jgi:hypothetical protein
MQRKSLTVDAGHPNVGKHRIKFASLYQKFQALRREYQLPRTGPLRLRLSNRIQGVPSVLLSTSGV